MAVKRKKKGTYTVMIIGSGGREHAIAWKCAHSPIVSRIICVPGNAGMDEIATCIPFDINDCSGLAGIARENGVDITIVGPEAPLSLGIVDVFQEQGLKIFGPTKEAAQIESSKAFAKNLMKETGILTPDFEIFTNHGYALEYAKKRGFPVVVKADGLAAGKGVFVCKNLIETQRTIQNIMVQKIFGKAGERIIIEELLTGEEVSFLAFTDGKAVLPMVSSQDHKPVYDNDKGPNTGGMGAYSPAPVITPQLHDQIMNQIMIPIVNGLTKKGITYKGILYAGLMIKNNEPYVLEFNCRFGDPEAQPILMRMNDDLIPIINAVLEEKLLEVTISWNENPSVCVIAASHGYPGPHEKGKEIKGLEKVSKLHDVKVFHASTIKKDKMLLTSGGRVLGVTALGTNLKEAVDRAYNAISMIKFEGIYFRKDIGYKGLRRLGLL